MDELERKNISRQKRNINFINDVHALHDSFLNDYDKKHRLEDSLCKVCFYTQKNNSFVPIAGQAITTHNCESCGVEMIFNNTRFDCLCVDCSVQRNMCKHCTADL